MRSIHNCRAAVLVTALIPCLGGCTIEDPELPTYESVWLIPLGNVDYTMEELTEDEEGFLVGVDKSLSFFVEGGLDPVEVGDQLTFEVEGATADASMGAFDLDPIGPIPFAFRLGDLYPPAQALDGTVTPVPPFTFDLTTPPQDVPGFASAQVESGTVDVEMRNELPVPVGGTAAPESIVLELTDPATGAVLASAVIDSPIAPGASLTRTIDLSGVLVPDFVGVRLRGGSPGSGGSTVTVDADAQVAVVLQTTVLTVSAARGEIPPHEFTDVITVRFPEARLVGATVASGTLDLELSNDLAVPVTVHVGAVVLHDASDRPLSLDVVLPASSIATRQVDLAGYRVDFAGVPSDQFDIDLTIRTPGSGGQSVWVQQGDQVHASVRPFTIGFATVSGIIEPRAVDLPQTRADIALSSKLEDLELLAAELVVELRSSFGLPARIDLHLEGFSDQETMVPLDVVLDLPPARPGESHTHRAVLNETNSELLPFMNNLPVRVTAQATANVGDGATIGTIAATDAVAATYAITAPLVVKVLPHVVEIDPTAVELADDLKEELDKRLVAATLEATVSNTLPLDATVYLSFDPDPDQVHVAPQLRLGPIDVPRSTSARSGGQLGSAVVTSEVELEEDMVPVLLQPELSFGVSFDVVGTDGKYVTIRADDVMRVQGYVRARVRMGELR